MKVSGDKSGINISELTNRESWALKSAIERELNFAKEYNSNKKVDRLKNLELHIEILEKLLFEINNIRNGE